VTHARVWGLAFALAALPLFAGAAGVDTADYEEVSQAELVRSPDRYDGKKVCFTDVFRLTGSDFCYRFRRTEINTKDFFCFALGTPGLVRLYLKKDHAQADRLLNLNQGDRVTACGTFDHQGTDYNLLVVDAIAAEEQP
jgi:hypothetical protein